MRWASDIGDAEIINGARPCYHLSLYMRQAEKFRKKYNARHIILATDSHRVVSETKLYPNFTWHFIDFDRAGTLGSTSNMGKQAPSDDAIAKHGTQKYFNFIEFKKWKSANQKQIALLSGLADLELLSRGDMFIGTSASTFGVAAWNLIWARTGVMPPYELVDTCGGYFTG